ncbi:MAG: hypothetical protein AAB947_01635 [Patescibacteria group bacterium]
MIKSIIGWLVVAMIIIVGIAVIDVFEPGFQNQAIRVFTSITDRVNRSLPIFFDKLSSGELGKWVKALFALALVISIWNWFSEKIK